MTGHKARPAAQPSRRPIGTARHFLIPVIVILAAVLLRLGHDAEMSRTPFFRHPGLDAAWHDEWARRIMSGQESPEPFFRAPGYAYFLAAVYRLLGDEPWPIHVVQAFLGGLTAWLVYRLARRPFGRGAGRIAAALAAVHGPLVYFDGELLAPSLAVPLFLLALHLTLRARRPVDWIMAGAVYGLGAVVLPNVLAVTAGLGMSLFLLSWFGRKGPDPTVDSVSNLNGPGRTAARAILPLAAGLSLAVAPVVVRNALVGGDLTGIASQGGVNFYAGNNPAATGITVVLPQFDRQPGWREFVQKTEQWASRQAGRRLKPSEVSAFYAGLGWRYWREDPVRAGRLTLMKSYYLLNGHEIPNNRDLYHETRYSLVLRALVWHIGPFHFPMGLIWPLAVIGLCVGWSRDSWPLHLFSGLYAVSVVLFFVTERYRLPVIPVLLVFAGCGLMRLSKLRRLPLILAGAALVIANTHFGHAGDGNPAQEVMRLGEAHFEAGEFRRAAAEFERAGRLDPRSPEPPARLGAAFLETGDPKAALEAYGRSLALGSKDPLAWFNFGTLNLAAGRPAEAREALAGAVQRDPDYVGAWINLGLAEASMGDFTKAGQALDRALLLDPGNAEAREEKKRLEAFRRSVTGRGQ